ncbi:MAG: hypothetical protein NC092_07030 [Butyrivibrio sp.]|nr:hypothetical protein [Muribaculum sp.]MCM1552429.1 hypothetical protein [Butyrivibrio sp.]
MKKVTSQQVFLIVIVVGILACLMVYLNVFQTYNEKTEALKTSNATLEQEVNELKPYYDNREVYRADAKEMIEDIDERTAEYPGNVLEEDAIMMAVDLQSVATLNYTEISIGELSEIHEIDEDIVAQAGAEKYQQPISFQARNVTYSNDTDYANLKNAIARIYESPYKAAVNSIVYKKESTSNRVIEGTIDITYYCIDGMGKDYTAPAMPEYLDGVSDLFGLLETENGSPVVNIEVPAEGAEAQQ